MDIFQIYCKNCNDCLKKTKINEKEAGLAHLKSNVSNIIRGKNVLIECTDFNDRK